MPLKIKKQSIFTSFLALNGLNAEALVEKTYLESSVLFDENGQIISQKKFFPSGEPDSSLERKFDEKGWLLEEVTFAAENEISEKRAFVYNANNQIEKEYFYYLDNSFDTVFYEYGEENRLKIKRTVNEDNITESQVEFFYSGQNLVEIVHTDSDRNITEKLILMHDANANVIEERHESGDTVEHVRNYYDETSRLIKTMRKSSSETVEIGYDYDEAGKIISEIHSVKGKIIKQISNKYDEGLVREIKEIYYVPGMDSAQELVKKIEYEFFQDVSVNPEPAG